MSVPEPAAVGVRVTGQVAAGGGPAVTFVFYAISYAGNGFLTSLEYLGIFFLNIRYQGVRVPLQAVRRYGAV